MKNALILLAGGVGKRLGTKDPKQFLKIGNTNLIEHYLSNLNNRIFDIVIIAIKNKDRKKWVWGWFFLKTGQFQDKCRDKPSLN